MLKCYSSLIACMYACVSACLPYLIFILDLETNEATSARILHKTHSKINIHYLVAFVLAYIHNLYHMHMIKTILQHPSQVTWPASWPPG